jgi:hypothetical protein
VTKRQFVSGIHNYCDRWCERCEMTARCAIYDPTRDRRRNPKAGAKDDADFWKELGETLVAALALVHEMAAKRGISLDDADMAEYERVEGRRRAGADAHPLARLSNEYAASVREWFTEHDSALRERDRELRSSHAMELPGRQPEADAALIGDCIEVILWHQYQIHTKLMRALLYEPLVCDGPDDPTDADGSTKVALIAADRSLAAWGRLREHFPAATDGILDRLLLLDRIRRLAERTFPQARAFVRPGFDEPPPRMKGRAPSSPSPRRRTS